MTLRDDIADSERLDDITVTVTGANQVFTSAVAWRLTVIDEAGAEFTVKIWHTHDVDTWWHVGWQYVLRQGRGSHQRDGEIVLHSTADFSASRPDGVVDILALGDSHIGRENRPDDENPPNHTARQFIAAMGYAARYDVNAVVHAGDLFDDDPTPADMTLAKAGFAILSEHGIPFYYIHGNHGTESAAAFIEQLTGIECVHLDTQGDQLTDTVELFGVDNGDGQFTATIADFEMTSDVDQRILVVHTEIDPPRADTGVPVERVSVPGDRTFDTILAGHLHNPESATRSGTHVQHLGTTAAISALNGATGPSAWLIRVTPSEIDRVRIDVR